MKLAAISILTACAYTRGQIEPPRGEVIVDDTAADFSAGALVDAVVDPLGLVVPDAFALGGLHARAYLGSQVTAATTWTDLVLGAPVGERYGELPVTNWGGDRPYGLGLTAAHVDNFTVVYDGEIYLDEGATSLALAANGQGFIELDLGAVRPSLHAHFNDPTPATITVSIPSGGWYPIRGAVSDTGGAAWFILSTPAGSITPDRLRARISAAHGVAVVGAADRIFSTLQPGSSVEPTLAQRDWTNVAPSYDLYGVGASNYALRFGGQLRVDVAEPYTFALDYGNDANDYVRLIVDGTPVAGHWPGGIDQPASAPIELAPGWHDLVLDYTQYNGVAKLQVLASTPTMAAAPLPPERLRPVRTGGLLVATIAPDTTIADASTTMVPLAPAAPAEAVVDFVDLFFEVIGQARSDLSVALVQPAGTDALALPSTPAYETVFDYMPDRTALAGAPVATTWQVAVTDTIADSSAGYVHYAMLLASYHGGPAAPFAKLMSYTSPPHATDGATTIDAITVTGELHGAALQLEVDTGAGWVAYTGGAIAAGATIRYRLTISGDGWQYPTVDKVEIDFTSEPHP